MSRTNSIQVLTAWANATENWDAGNSQDCLNNLLDVQNPCSKMDYNIGCAYLALGHLKEAAESFTSSLTKDEHMAIAYFQRACVHFKANRLDAAKEDFLECQKKLRGRTVIDYGQLGLKYKLYGCEAEHNLGVLAASGGDMTQAVQHVEKAVKGRVELRHKVISESLQKLKNGEVISLVEVPRDAIYRPPKGKVANINKQDYLGKAKVISAVDHQEKDFSGFIGPKKREEQKRLSPQDSPPKSPQKSPGGSPRLPRAPNTIEQLMVAAQAIGPRLGSPALREAATNGKAHRGSPPKGDRLSGGRPEFLRSGSQDDMVLPLPNRKAPVLPPRRMSEDPAALRAQIRGVSSRLPPPPTRPPPKLDRKPLPQEPNAPPVLPRKLATSRFQMFLNQDLVEVDLVCNETRTLEVLHRCPLHSLITSAQQEFKLQEGSFNLWRKRVKDDATVPIMSEEEMQQAWQETSGRRLTLWCYSK